MKTIIILIGQKGSGKTYIGTLLNEKLGIPFLRIENIFKRIRKDRSVYDKDYITEGFMLFEQELNNRLIQTDIICFESTGTAPEFDELLERLKNESRVILVKIDAGPELCLRRVKERDLSEHIDVSDDDINYINQISRCKKYDFDLVIDNNDKAGDRIIQEITALKF